MRILFLDCFSGISGDMTVGALCDLGVTPSTFEWELSKLEIGDFHMHFARQQRQAIEGVKFDIHEGATHTNGQGEEDSCCDHDHGHSDAHSHAHEHTHSHEHGHQCCDHDHGHSDAHSHAHEHTHSHEHGHKCCDHDHGHSEAHSHPHEHTHSHEHGHQCCDHDHGHSEAHSHPHEHTHSHEHGHQCCDHDHGHSHDHDHDDHAHGRSFLEIKGLIEQSDLSDFVKKHAVSIFHRIAVAEGRIHGKPPEEVAFHEVGALDSIADIICVCVGIEQLGVEKIFVSNLHDGRGWIQCAHGTYPIPAAATLELLKGIPLAQIDEPYEFITPTGAAIVAEFGASFGTMPRMRADKIGYGIGTRKLPTRPNVLRAVLGEMESPSASSYQIDTIARIETNLDDLSPEITGAAVSRLLDAGALDVYLTPIQMKKNRPGVQLTVLCEEAALHSIADLLFNETSSFGVRIEHLERWKLERCFKTVTTPYGNVSIKIGLRGDEVITVAPEFEDCRKISETSGQPLRAVYEAALNAFRISQN